MLETKRFPQRSRVRARLHAGCTRQICNGLRNMVVTRVRFSGHVQSRERVIEVRIHANTRRTIPNRLTRSLPNVERGRWCIAHRAGRQGVLVGEVEGLVLLLLRYDASIIDSICVMFRVWA
jgi:hypothetical protein